MGGSGNLKQNSKGDEDADKKAVQEGNQEALHRPN